VVYLLDGTPSTTPFPDVEQAEREPDGLLAIGGDLSPERLLNAYRVGIFPWYCDGQPILWWSPDPRMVLFPARLHVSRSLRKTQRRGLFRTSIDTDFDAVVQACSAPRSDGAGTWLVAEMIQAYRRLHRLGHAHSVEVWANGELVGGLYGVALGRVFFGESMFSRRSDASKIALVYLTEQLQRQGFKLIDCQVQTPHLRSLGAEEIPRQEFSRLLRRWCALERPPGPWPKDPR
jgi:leucyl/phenylalanyl-tRNA--protein transferase